MKQAWRDCDNHSSMVFFPLWTMRQSPDRCERALITKSAGSATDRLHVIVA